MIIFILVQHLNNIGKFETMKCIQTNDMTQVKIEHPLARLRALRTDNVKLSIIGPKSAKFSVRLLKSLRNPYFGF